MGGGGGGARGFRFELTLVKEELKKYFIKVIHKFSEFRPLFSETKGKQNFCGLRICVPP